MQVHISSALPATPSDRLACHSDLLNLHRSIILRLASRALRERSTITDRHPVTSQPQPIHLANNIVRHDRDTTPHGHIDKREAQGSASPQPPQTDPRASQRRARQAIGPYHNARPETTVRLRTERHSTATILQRERAIRLACHRPIPLLHACIPRRGTDRPTTHWSSHRPQHPPHSPPSQQRRRRPPASRQLLLHDVREKACTDCQALSASQTDTQTLDSKVTHSDLHAPPSPVRLFGCWAEKERATQTHPRQRPPPSCDRRRTTLHYTPDTPA